MELPCKQSVKLTYGLVGSKAAACRFSTAGVGGFMYIEGLLS